MFITARLPRGKCRALGSLALNARFAVSDLGLFAKRERSVSGLFLVPP